MRLSFRSRRRARPGYSASLFIATLAALFMCLEGKRVEGQVTLKAGQALVVTKFCFDYNPACKNQVCPSSQKDPGRFQLSVFNAKRLSSQKSDDDDEEEESPQPSVRSGLDEFQVALLDDEYFSFPEVSQVWGEANCSDVLKAAKKSFPLPWSQVTSRSGADVQSEVVEHLRPRWWYVALVSCSKTSVDLSYRMHLENPQRGWESEFSMDQRGIYEMAWMSCIIYAVLVAVQLASLQKWRTLAKRGHRWYEVHPALLLATACTLLALVGQTCTFVYYSFFSYNGESPERWSFVGRLCSIAAQNTMSTLLMLMAHGDCICTIQIRWAQHSEMVFGMVLYACLQLPLEMWGDSESRNTSTEYIYDTRPGMILVTFNLLWTWMYISRSVQTFRSETRIKAKSFYKRYSFVFLLWFVYIPMIALLARSVAPHARAYVTNALATSAHVLMLAILVYTFRPSVADEIYDLKESEFESVHNDDELESILNSTDEF